MRKLLQISRNWGFIHLLKICLTLIWRHFPWPKGKGKYFTKQFVEKIITLPGFVPMWTKAGWLFLEKQDDILQNTLFMNGVHYEKEITNFIEKNISLSSKATVFDVGSHVGYYTLLLAKKVGDQGKIFAFEPQPKLAKGLKSSLELNRINWVKVENLAVTASCGQVVLFQTPDSGRTSIADLLYEKKQTLEVSTISLDGYIENHDLPIPELVKMDIEGAEWFAIKGMTDLLTSQHPPMLIVEMHPAQIEVLGGTIEGFISCILQTNKYDLYWIHPRQGLMKLSESLPQKTTWHLFAQPRV